jgi:hypothetical protein
MAAPPQSSANRGPEARLHTLFDLIPAGQEDGDYYEERRGDALALAMRTGHAAQPLYPFLPPLHRTIYNTTRTTMEESYTGGAAWGERISFRIPLRADAIHGIGMYVELGHWLPGNILSGLMNGTLAHTDVSGSAWAYADRLGACLFDRIELELNGVTVESFPGEWIDVYSRAWLACPQRAAIADCALPDIGPDRRGTTAKYSRQRDIYPTEDGSLFVWFPFWFWRHSNSVLPIASLAEGSAVLHVTFRAFSDCVRRVDASGRTCHTQTPLAKTMSFVATADNETTTTVTTQTQPPEFRRIRMLVDGVFMEDRLRALFKPAIDRPLELLMDQLRTYTFDEPWKYAVPIQSASHALVHLPIECGGPLKEIMWVVRRKAALVNADRTNYSAVLEQEYDETYAPFAPLLERATVQVEGRSIEEGDELKFRRTTAESHTGGYGCFANYIYAHSFAMTPETYEPSGSLNASRVGSVRLALLVKQPLGSATLDWEVLVFVVRHNWLRVQGHHIGTVFSD